MGGNVWEVFVCVGETEWQRRWEAVRKGYGGGWLRTEQYQQIYSLPSPSTTWHNTFYPHKHTRVNKTVEHLRQKEKHLRTRVITSKTHNSWFQLLFLCSISPQLCVVRNYWWRSGVLSSVQCKERRRGEIRQEKVVLDRLTLHGLWRRPGIGFQLHVLIKHSSVTR